MIEGELAFLHNVKSLVKTLPAPESLHSPPMEVAALSEFKRPKHKADLHQWLSSAS